MIQVTSPLTTPATRPANSQRMARSRRRSGSGLARASAMPSNSPARKAATPNSAHRAKLIEPALVGLALIKVPCTSLSSTIPIANSSPRGNQVVMGR